LTLTAPALANKQYISPIRLFDHCGIDYNGEINLQRIKKQLIAEFDFSKTGFIETSGYTYNKNDVLEEIERPDFANRLTYHQRLWASKPILSVLENNQVDMASISMAFDKFQGEPEFDSFFSPYFAAPFNHICRSFINDGRLDKVGQWLWFRDFLQMPEREEGFKAIRIFLEENDRLFKNISKENYDIFRPKIKHWIETGWVDLFNNLPDEFYQQKNQLIVELINLTVKIQRIEAGDCRRISNGLIALREVPGDLSSTIASNHTIYNGSSSTSSSPNYWWIAWLVIFVVRLLAHGGCN